MVERQTSPFFAFNPGVTLSTHNSFSFAQSNQVLLAGYAWETDSIVASFLVFSYLEYRDSASISNTISQMYKIGPAEVLWKAGRVGLRFDGFTFGYDFRQGFSDVYKWNIVETTNLVRTPSVRLDVRTGYQGEQFRVNDNPISRTAFPQALVLSWQLSRFTGQLKAEVRLYLPWEQNEWELELSGYMRFRLFSLGPVETSLRLDAGFTRQPFLQAYQVQPNIFFTTFGLEVRF